MKRLKLLTIASAVAAAFAVPAALAQQSGAPDSSGRIQQRDATGNPQSSPTQPPRQMSTDRPSDPTMRSGAPMRGETSMGSGYPGAHGSSTVRDAQQALHDKGFDVGPIDGVMGPRTESAVRDYQRQQGMTPSGRLDRETLSGLNVQASAGDSMRSPGERTRGGTMGDRTGASGSAPGNPGSGAIGAGSPSGTTRGPASSTSGTAGSTTDGTGPGASGPASSGQSGSGAIGSGSPSGSTGAGAGRGG
jgi:peptidoglycan hydrolase-like protein with peptidoglycan-binding domain